MALVDYSDSDGSDTEAASAPKPSAKPAKGTFHKVVDRSNPGKIRVSLPQPVQNQNNEDEHQAKRVKTGGDGLSGFNSFLPPPKRTGEGVGVSLRNGNVLPKSGLFAGVSLKTGAAPGFIPEMEHLSEMPGTNSVDRNGESQTEDDADEQNLPPAKTWDDGSQKPIEEVKLVGKPLMFKPLSVARSAVKTKKQKEISAAPVIAGKTSMSSITIKAEPPTVRPKMALFSISSEPSDSISVNPSREYQPIIYGVSVDQEQDLHISIKNSDSTNDEYAHTPQIPAPGSTTSMNGAQSLNDIASDLKLSAADRRQLFGRQKGGALSQATKIINFNTDDEYRHNQELRASGEQVVHNPVRAIAPGKHSLKQLVNAATNQKEALEESFAKGKSNRAEASSRYGW